MQSPRALTLDLDDTLLDGEGLQESIDRVCTEIAAAHPTLDAEQLNVANAAVWEEYWVESAAADWCLGRIESSAFSMEGWRRTLLACGCTDAIVVKEATDLYREIAHQAHRLYDDVLAFLDLLVESNTPIALITNGASDIQREKLGVLQIEDRFVAVVVSAELGAAKPDVLPFQAAVLALGCESADVWHVGDNLSADVAGAQRAGLESVWLNRHGRVRAAGDPEPDLEVGSLAELAAILQEYRSET
jgi:putative hydrolase of the HAD superfamily